MILGMNIRTNRRTDFRGFKVKIIKFEYKIGIKLISVDYDLQEIFVADLIGAGDLVPFLIL